MKTVTITKKKFSQKTCTVFVLSMLEKTVKQYAPPFIDIDEEYEYNTQYKSFRMLKYFPFPQPTSSMSEYGSSDLINSTTPGHALCRVLLK